jgi:TolA-binding protein
MPTVNQSEAARILGISRRTVKRRIEAGELASVDTPDGPMVVLEDKPAPTPPTGHAHPDAHRVPTPEDVHGAVNFATRGTDDLAARLERAESRIDRLLETVHAQNQTIQAQTIRLAQLEGRMIDAAPAETPAEPQEPGKAPDIATARTGGLRAWYRRLRRGH